VNGERTIAFSSAHAPRALGFLVDLVLSGRYRATTKDLKRLQGDFNRDRGIAFNQAIAERYREVPGLIVRENVKKLVLPGGERLVSTVGDIDVLVADPTRRRLIVNECKDLAVARAPQEMAHELEGLFVRKGGGKSIIEHHAERVAWVREHRAAILAWLGIDVLPKHVKKWTVEAQILVDQPLMAPFLKRASIPVIAYVELDALLSESERGNGVKRARRHRK
jgi:hypothetical protein